jgi:hypothetical protein
MKIVLFLVLFISSLSLQTGFALTTQTCEGLLKQGGKVNPLLASSLTVDQIIGCASPSAAKTQPLSPLVIFQLIINAIAVLAFGLAVLALIVASIKMATSAGDKNKFGEGVTLAKNAGLALVLVLTAYTLVYLVLNSFGFNL